MITESKIDAAGKALREHDMHGRITREWDKLPKSAKSKWLCKASAALEAAESVT